MVPRGGVVSSHGGGLGAHDDTAGWLGGFGLVIAGNVGKCGIVVSTLLTLGRANGDWESWAGAALNAGAAGAALGA